MEAIRIRISEARRKLEVFLQTHSIQTQKAAYIGCQKCGSKLKKELLRGERCPLCGTDLRSTTTLQRIEGYQAKIRALEEEYQQEECKNKKNATIRWLVQYSYHG